MPRRFDTDFRNFLRGRDQKRAPGNWIDRGSINDPSLLLSTSLNRSARLKKLSLLLARGFLTMACRSGLFCWFSQLFENDPFYRDAAFKGLWLHKSFPFFFFQRIPKTKWNFDFVQNVFCLMKYRCASRLEMKSASNICIEAKRVSRWVSSSIEISFSGRWRVFFESYGMCPRWSCPKRGSSSMHANFFFQERDFSSLVCLASRQEHRAVTKCVFDEGTLHPR